MNLSNKKLPLAILAPVVGLLGAALSGQTIASAPADTTTGASFVDELPMVRAQIADLEARLDAARFEMYAELKSLPPEQRRVRVLQFERSSFEDQVSLVMLYRRRDEMLTALRADEIAVTSKSPYFQSLQRESDIPVEGDTAHEASSTLEVAYRLNAIERANVTTVTSEESPDE